MSLARLATGRRVPRAVFESRPVRELENAAVDDACLTNDLFSYQKEIEFEGELHNGVPGGRGVPRAATGRRPCRSWRT